MLYALGMASGFLFEYLGVNYGFPFGHYEYLAFERTKVLGVPVPIVMAWGAYVYAAYISVDASGWRRVLAASLMLVSLDLAVDPAMVKLGLWVWRTGCPCIFGIPVTNYLGWFFTSLIALITYKSLFEEPERIRWGLLTFLSLYLPIVAVSHEFIPLASSLALTILIWILFRISDGKKLFDGPSVD